VNVAVVILNWNGVSLLERFLPSVIKYSTTLATVYVADNDSTDNSVSYIKEKFPSVKVVQNEINGGYAKGYNDALKHIEAEVYVLLNSDVEVTEGWLNPMIDLFKDSKIGAAQPKIKDLNKKTHFEYAGGSGGFLDSMAYPYCRGRIFNICEEDTGQYNDTIEVQWASGACLFVRATDFWNVKGFDERYFAHQEEIDLCWRIRNNDKKIMASGSSEVYHLGGATLNTENSKKIFYNFRNTLYNVVKNINGIKALFIVIARLYLDGIAGLKFLLEGKYKNTLAIIKAHFSFYYYLPSLLKSRKALKSKSNYASTPSIVWSYYIEKKKTYTMLQTKK